MYESESHVKERGDDIMLGVLRNWERKIAHK